MAQDFQAFSMQQVKLFHSLFNSVHLYILMMIYSTIEKIQRVIFFFSIIDRYLIFGDTTQKC